MIKIYLDDIRNEPEWYVLSRTPKDFMRLVWPHVWEIELISFDHDLWEKEWAREDEEGNIQKSWEITWYELLLRTIQTYKCLWLDMPRVILHTANPVWYMRMESALIINNLHHKLIIW
jgi:hypothetical protein